MKHRVVTLAVQRIMASGPSRVMISAEEAKPSRRAREQYGIVPDVIFIRDDGWSLGAPSALAAAAERIWKDQWVAVLRRPETEAIPYDQYREASL